MGDCHVYAIVDWGDDVGSVHCTVKGPHTKHVISAEWEEPPEMVAQHRNVFEQ